MLFHYAWALCSFVSLYFYTVLWVGWYFINCLCYCCLWFFNTCFSGLRTFYITEYLGVSILPKAYRLKARDPPTFRKPDDPLYLLEPQTSQATHYLVLLASLGSDLKRVLWWFASERGESAPLRPWSSAGKRVKCSPLFGERREDHKIYRWIHTMSAVMEKVPGLTREMPERLCLSLASLGSQAGRSGCLYWNCCSLQLEPG